MKRFQFTLETILKLRLEEEQEAEMRLGRAMGEWNRINDKKLNRQETRNRCVRVVPGTDLIQSGLYIARLDQEILKLQKELDDRERELERLREEYRMARAGREGLDKLKDKRQKEYYDIRSRVEAHSLDDLLNNMNRLKQAGD